MHDPSAWQPKQVLILLYLCQQESRRPVDSAVATLDSIGKGDDPLQVWLVLPEHPKGHAKSSALGVPREGFREGHPIELYHLVPLGPFHQAQHLPLVERRTKLHRSFQLTRVEDAEMQGAILNDLP